MMDDRLAALAGCHGASLHPFAGIAQRHLVSPLAEPRALHPDAEACLVHHDEHGFETPVGLAHQPADRSPAVTE